MKALKNSQAVPDHSSPAYFGGSFFFSSFMTSKCENLTKDHVKVDGEMLPLNVLNVNYAVNT